jgi:hypothetical protein
MMVVARSCRASSFSRELFLGRGVATYRQKSGAKKEDKLGCNTSIYLYQDFFLGKKGTDRNTNRVLTD